ncbi:MAG: hypothetical protein K0U16_07230 [Gammaproteobacteria bacterium]|nr:hypothetical protein [Gammaproteobacteria bacterium]
MKSRTKVALGLAAGVLVGTGIGYLVFTRTSFGRRAIKDAEDAIDDTGIRFPQPSFAVEVAYDPEQFQILDELVCECAAPIVEQAAPNDTLDDVVPKIQECMAKELYPDFPWPPVPGDHPTVSMLWSELALLARRAIVTQTICEKENRLS